MNARDDASNAQNDAAHELYPEEEIGAMGSAHHFELQVSRAMRDTHSLSPLLASRHAHSIAN